MATMQTPSETVQKQHAEILRAIELLQNDLNEMTGSVDPKTESWRDVAEYAHAAEAARTVIAAYGE